MSDINRIGERWARKHHIPTAEQGRQIVAERQAARDAVQYPTKVRRREFISRSLAAEVAAGRCTVSRKTYLETWIILDLVHKGGNNFIATLSDGREVRTGEWEGELDVEWHLPKPAPRWTPVVAPHPLDAEMHPVSEAAFTWQRHPVVVYFKPEA